MPVIGTSVKRLRGSRVARRTVLAAAFLVLPAVRSLPAVAADDPTAVATISSFYDVLLSVMKDGPSLGFNGRRERLAPAIHRTFDLPLMTRLMVGPQWVGLTAGQQQQLVTAFSDFSVATYANRFDDFSGERFQVAANTAPSPEGTVVTTKMIKGDGDSVEIDYLMHQSAGSWQIIDVYLSGTVSELATRRSEFSSVLRRGGPDALVDLLQKKTLQLRG
jgi:phospholipid transport system substrate-binding protein